MAHHDEILAAAQRILDERGEKTFTPDDIVRALPHLNAATIRTHVTSRCCVNAPKNHPHKWDYFRRVERGRYEITPKYRKTRHAHAKVREAHAEYTARASAEPRATLHGVISRSGKWYVAECLELPVVTQGHSLDETVANLREAVQLHLDGEPLETLNLAPALALQLTFETARFRVAAD